MVVFLIIGNERRYNMWKPQIFSAISFLAVVAVVAMFTGAEYGDAVVTGCIAGITGLGMALANGK